MEQFKCILLQYQTYLGTSKMAITSPSAICTVNGQAISTTGTSGIDVASGASITIALTSNSGVNSWSISATQADDITQSNGNLVSINNSKSVTSYSATFAMPISIGGRGSSVQFTSIVNAGLPNECSTTFGVFVLCSTGNRLFFGGETIESNATVGNAADLNRMFNQGSPTGFAYGDLTGSYPSPTIANLQGKPVSAATPLFGEVLGFDGTTWVPTAGGGGGGGGPPSGAASGDLSGTYPAPNVVQARGLKSATTTVSVSTASAPVTGQILTAINSSSASWQNAATGFTAGGDLSGTPTIQTVTSIHGASVPIAGSVGNILYVSGASALSYGALNLGGGSNYVTGTLPLSNQALQTLSGDASGTTGAVQVNISRGLKSATTTVSVSAATAPTNGQVLTATSSTTATWQSVGAGFTAGGDLTGTSIYQNVVGVNGASVPIAGTLTTGNGLYVTGASALSYGALNLAGGSNYVTGLLPKGNQAVQDLAGDVSGNTGAAVVNKLKGKNLSTSLSTIGSLQDGYVLTWVNGASEYRLIPAPAGTFTAGGDLTGSESAQTVVGLYNHDLASTAPIASAVPVYSATSFRYDVRKLTLDDLDPAFAITSFSGGSTVEVGATVTNPSFTASYSTAASSAIITNDDAQDTPHSLTTPFTSATITGAFHKTSATSITFHLQAVAATTKDAYDYITFLARSFAGIGTAGATSATASVDTAVLVGASGTLANEGLKSTDIGSTTASLSPTAQKIYYMCPHTATAHSFHDQNGFSFPMNAPTTFSFTNQNGAVLSYDLYEATFLNSTPFTLTVVS